MRQPPMLDLCRIADLGLWQDNALGDCTSVLDDAWQRRPPSCRLHGHVLAPVQDAWHHLPREDQGSCPGCMALPPPPMQAVGAVLAPVLDGGHDIRQGANYHRLRGPPRAAGALLPGAGAGERRQGGEDGVGLVEDGRMARGTREERGKGGRTIVDRCGGRLLWRHVCCCTASPQHTHTACA